MASKKQTTTPTTKPSSASAEEDRPTLNPLDGDADGLADALSADSDVPPPPSTKPEPKEEKESNPLLPKSAVAPEPPPEPPLLTRADAKAGRRLYRVWAHGSLKRNGKTYAPGETLTLTPEDAAALGCVEPQ